MTPYALLDVNGYVTNRISSATDPGSPWIEVPSYVDVGWRLDGLTWIPPRPYDVEAVKLQRWFAMEDILDGATAALDVTTPKLSKQLYLIDWHRLEFYVRDSDMIIHITDTMGLTEAEMDDHFREAALLP